MKNYMTTWIIKCRNAQLFPELNEYLRCWESRKTIDFLKSDSTKCTAEFGIISNDDNIVDEMLDGLSLYTSPYTEIVK